MASLSVTNVALSQEIIREEMWRSFGWLVKLKPKNFRYFEQLCRGTGPCQTILMAVTFYNHPINVSISQKVVKTMMWICKNQIFSWLDNWFRKTFKLRPWLVTWMFHCDCGCNIIDKTVMWSEDVENILKLKSSGELQWTCGTWYHLCWRDW